MNDTKAQTNPAEQAAAYQKIWTESMTKLMQTACTVTPGTPPPEMLRQMRSGMLQALGQSWDEFMRSPQFLEGNRQMMENAVNFRKISNEFLARTRNELQAPSREDVDTILLSVRHMEKRLLDRIEALSTQVQKLEKNGNGTAQAKKTPAKKSK